MEKRAQNTTLALCGLITLLMAGCGFGTGGKKEDREKRVKEAKKAAIPAKEFYERYAEKHQAGKQEEPHEMEGERSYVRGKIDTIREGAMGTPFLKLGWDGTVASIQCFMEADGVLEKLQIGDELIVFGKCDRLHMDLIIVFTECRVAWHPDHKDLYLRQKPLMGDEHYR